MAKKLSWVMAVWAGTCAPAIHADVLQQFAVSGNFYEYDGSGNAFPGGSISGTETIDVTLGSIVESSLEAMVYGKSYSFHGAPTYQGAQANSASPDDPDQTPLAYEADFSNGNDELQLNLPIQGDIVGYGGGDLCSFDFGSCGAGNNAYFSYLGAQDLGLTFVNNGSLTPIGSPVITPEPSSLILLGTGFVGAAGALRRRLRCN